MDKYVRVDWPESQEWDDKRFDNDVFRIMDFYPIVFVPEELYNKVNNE